MKFLICQRVRRVASANVAAQCIEATEMYGES